MRRHQRFLREMTSEKGAQKYHSDDAFNTTQIWVVFRIIRAACEICFNQSEALPRSGMLICTCKQLLVHCATMPLTKKVFEEVNLLLLKPFFSAIDAV